MTREEAIEELKELRNEWSRHIYSEGVRKQISLDMAIKALEQESIDYKAQYESFSKKAEIIISQLREDRDRLLEVFDKIQEDFIARYPRNYAGGLEFGGRFCVFSLNDILNTIDKYKAESED